jgi:hypothetical protein
MTNKRRLYSNQYNQNPLLGVGENVVGPPVYHYTPTYDYPNK